MKNTSKIGNVRRFLMYTFSLIIVLGLGCVEETLPEPDIKATPPTSSLTVPPSLSVYGKLVDYSQSNDLTVFKIQSEIVNLELNDTYLEIEAKPQKYFTQTKELLNCLGLKADVEPSMLGVYDYPNLEEYLNAKGVSEKEIKICKEEILNNLIEKYPKCTEISMLDATEKDRNKWGFNLGCKLKINLIEGNNYVFYFGKMLNEREPWDRVVTTENLTEYKQSGAWRHENDLTIDQMLDEECGPPPATACQIFPTFIVPDGQTELKIKIINKQDNDLTYKISNVKLVDKNILEPSLRQCGEGEEEYQNITAPRPVTPSGEVIQGPATTLIRVCTKSPYGERSKDSIVNCTIDYDSSQNIVFTNSDKLASFKVMCDKSIKCSTIDCELVLLGDFEFVDELDNNHFKSNKFFKQVLSIAKESYLEVEYSKEISSKDEFYIYVDYKDSEGNTIKNAQIQIRFKDLGVKGIFTMRYDAKLEKYKFLWSNFVEWGPSYKEGTYQFTIVASASGNVIQRAGSYEFVLK